MQFYESDPLLNAEGVPVARFAIFSETPRNPKPQYNVQLAVNQYVGNHEYYDFVEEWLDNPWIRMIFWGLENIDYVPYQGGIQRRDFELIEGDGMFTGANLIILKADEGIENPKPMIESALIDAVNGASYNAFILSSLNYPWIKIAITGINNLNFANYHGQVANVQ